jgi:hypothetical protein
MQNINEDDRPTVVGSSAGHVANVNLRFDEAAQFSDYGGTVERPTVVRRAEPTISAVAWLYCSKGRRKGQLYRFSKERNEFGRAADADIPIEDDFASTHHGAFVLEGTEWKAYDFASKNGTFVNTQRLGSETENPKALVDGDTVAIGDSEFVFKRI